MSDTDTLFSTGQTSGVAAGINGNFRNRARAVKRQDITSNVSVENQYLQHGFSFIVGDGDEFSANKAITMPSAFDDTNYDVVLTSIGNKSGSDPTSRIDFSSISQVTFAINIDSSSQFTVEARTTDGSNLAASLRVGFCWIAIGTKA